MPKFSNIGLTSCKVDCTRWQKAPTRKSDPVALKVTLIIPETFSIQFMHIFKHWFIKLPGLDDVFFTSFQRFSHKGEIVFALNILRAIKLH